MNLIPDFFGGKHIFHELIFKTRIYHLSFINQLVLGLESQTALCIQRIDLTA